MEALPSYQEATTRPDWLPLVAPYLPPNEYPTLCQVNRQFWQVFAPRIWGNVFRTVRRAGLQSGDDLGWLVDFVFHQLPRTSPSSKALARVLDGREISKESFYFTPEHYTLRNQERSLSTCFQQALALLPDTSCLILDGHIDLDPSIVLPEIEKQNKLLLLSLANCPHPLPINLFLRSGTKHLVYLDASSIPGNIDPILQLNTLSNLRILKIRNHELLNSKLGVFIRHFRTQLWSLDISGNKISDDLVPSIIRACFNPDTLLSDAHFLTEGKPIFPGTACDSYGPFIYIRESEWSGSFSHPERYLVDAPVYRSSPELPLESPLRSDGQQAIRTDSLDGILREFSGQDPDLSDERIRTSTGITHLRLSNTLITALGVESFLRNSGGHLEDLACDNMQLIKLTSRQSELWPKGAKLYGILNAAHFVRPVFSSNLRVLRLHHSFVTQIPALEMEGVSAMNRLYIAETSILPRSEQLYPQAFVPDMNPRLTSLTLTHIPRRSSGPLIAKLVQFLKLLSVQERSIFDAKAASSSWRGSSGELKGLTHVRLEFDSDPMDEDFPAAQDFDAEALMNTGEQGFSFFPEDASKNQPSPPSRVDSQRNLGGTPCNLSQDKTIEARGEYLQHPLGQQHGADRTSLVPVWIAFEEPSRNTAIINDYRQLVLSSSHVRDIVALATPGQVMAGVPDQALIFQTAWCMAVMPKTLSAPPWTKLTEIKDVLEELKQFRRAGKAKHLSLQEQVTGENNVPPGEPHYFFTGHLEVSR
ncbi:hypothetical protein B0T10DRAFT_83567 [Thelonectria olida]|uniref:Uncharacterized protein n=1 Tax=Thelonectria olida TaxID=1576542 RepID=A0A9P9AQ58_9HYPO|nr:hypothetical protein B0T10DRAFT_83567 [Thelonectria olida]